MEVQGGTNEAEAVGILGYRLLPDYVGRSGQRFASQARGIMLPEVVTKPFKPIGEKCSSEMGAGANTVFDEIRRVLFPPGSWVV